MSEGPRKVKYSATRRLLLKSKLLKKAASMLVAEIEEKEREKERVVSESVPSIKSNLSAEELQELCKELHRKINVVDEARYDMEVKVDKNKKEILSLNQRVTELKGVKRPDLKRVKKTTDDMLDSCADSSKLMKADFKANLKTVKKDDDKKEEVTDWRKNVEAMSGMEGRKKLFNAGQLK